MKWIACLVGTLLGSSLGSQAGCQREERDAPAPVASVRAAAPASEYAADIAALCASVTRSGADKLAPDARAVTIANWLAANLTTAESRKFLVQIQPLQGDAKATALDAEATKVGLPGCALADEWRSLPR